MEPVAAEEEHETPETIKRGELKSSAVFALVKEANVLESLEPIADNSKRNTDT